MSSSTKTNRLSRSVSTSAASNRSMGIAGSKRLLVAFHLKEESLEEHRDV